MEKIKDSVLRQIESDYEKACNAWVLALVTMWGLDARNGYWIGDEPGDVYDFDGKVTIGMDDLRYAVRNGVTYEQYGDFTEYHSFLAENGLLRSSGPTLRDYIEARVPLYDTAARQRITEARENLLRICEEERERLRTKDS